MPYPRMTAEKFWAKVSPEPTSGCWLWTGGMYGNGYGASTWVGKSFKAHRVALMLSGVDVPDALDVCHRCDNRACVNPDHLYVGTHDDNMADKVRRNRCSRGERHGSACRAAITPEVMEARSKRELERFVARFLW